ncbi:hypothetical protein Goari_016543 [Gossypium aridum]|uniref:VHS domain-containing protein n=1 Tax=Gossypium aridum TaxID=34290 RepID=A0A7J8WIU5_GOSAI|nr:hypothetical protein [Gossypium aridum]
MEKIKLVEWGEKLKTSGAQISKMFSGKMKEILQGPTPESKMVDQATFETLEEANWGMNMRICSMINSEELNGTEIVRAIKSKISGKNVASQRLSLELLEACTMNCAKVASKVVSVLEEMVKMIENPITHHGNRKSALQLIRAWGQSEDLAYLPVFRQTYLAIMHFETVICHVFAYFLSQFNIKQNLEESSHQPVDNGNSPHLHHTLESYIGEPLAPSENYPINGTGLHGSDFACNYERLSLEHKRELFKVTRNSLEVLSSMLSKETQPKPTKDKLTESMLEMCKQSQLVILMIIESTTDNDGILFEALDLNDELQHLISKFEELEAGSKSRTQPKGNCRTKTSTSPLINNERKMGGSANDAESC